MGGLSLFINIVLDKQRGARLVGNVFFSKLRFGTHKLQQERQVEGFQKVRPPGVGACVRNVPDVVAWKT